MNKKSNRIPTHIQKLIKDKGGCRLDIGCGANKNPGFVGMDYEQYGDVDIIHNVEITPWPLPDESVTMATASHLLEHINPHTGDSRLQPLVELLIAKKLITKAEADKYMGEPGPAFLRFMDEAWRVLKPGGQFAAVLPHAQSPGMMQDPTHCNFINETTFHYFDPDPEGRSFGQALYGFYQPKPFRIVAQYFNPNGIMEVLLEKRLDDKTFHNHRGPDEITKERR